MVWILFFNWKSSVFRVRAVFCVSQQQTVFGRWTDDYRRLLWHRERRVEANVCDEGEEDGVWGCGNKWMYLCNRRILLLKRDLPAEHWEVWPWAGLMGDSGDSSQPCQITWMCLCSQCLVSNPYHMFIYCLFVPNGSNGEVYSVVCANVHHTRCQVSPCFALDNCL